MIRVAVAVAAVALVVGLAPRPAQADCDADIQALQTQVTEVGDARLKKLVQFDIDRAQRESAESDDDECHEAVEHARKLLKH